MRKLNRNYWRLGWILLTNGSWVLLFLSGPIRAYYQEERLYQVLRTPSQPFSYVHQYFSDPWMPLLVLALLGGIFAEVRRNVFSPIINLVPYLVWFIVGLREQIRVAGEVTLYEASWEKIFLAILAVIIAIDAFFYVIALKPPFLPGVNTKSVRSPSD
jgi:hypothetical protein